MLEQNLLVEMVWQSTAVLIHFSWRVLAKRGLAHFLVLCLLLGSAYAVVILVERSKDVTSKSSWWRQNELSVILTLISQEFPSLFDVRTFLSFRNQGSTQNSWMRTAGRQFNIQI